MAALKLKGLEAKILTLGDVQKEKWQLYTPKKDS
jgi:hypothetical protein